MGFDKRIYNEQAFTGLDANVLNAVTAAFDLTAYFNLAVLVAVTSGSFSSAVLTLEISDDGITWFSSGTTINAAGLSDKLSTVMKFARLRVSTQNGAALVLNGKFFGKR